MTGFGKQVLQLPGKKVTIEVKSLNSKQVDINMRLPALYRPKEGEIRQFLANELQRGKIDCAINQELTGVESAPRLNEPLAEAYLKQTAALCQRLDIEGDFIGPVLRLPEIFTASDEELSGEEWQKVLAAMKQSVVQMQEYRSTEGERLKIDLELRLSNIAIGLEKIEPFEADRTQRLKDRLMRSLEQLQQEVNQERFEQELIYYLEKFDTTEEKVRLRSHLTYFEELMVQGGPIGKKLGFVAQEIGREINTLGSKANHAEVQRIVVEMKDELEKIKEQVLNIL
jgi:uncharacterized protein (TIGR00255 family)